MTASQKRIESHPLHRICLNLKPNFSNCNILQHHLHTTTGNYLWNASEENQSAPDSSLSTTQKTHQLLELLPTHQQQQNNNSESHSSPIHFHTQSQGKVLQAVSLGNALLSYQPLRHIIHSHQILHNLLLLLDHNGQIFIASKTFDTQTHWDCFPVWNGKQMKEHLERTKKCRSIIPLAVEGLHSRRRDGSSSEEDFQMDHQDTTQHSPFLITFGMLMPRGDFHIYRGSHLVHTLSEVLMLQTNHVQLWNCPQQADAEQRDSNQGTKQAESYASPSTICVAKKDHTVQLYRFNLTSELSPSPGDSTLLNQKTVNLEKYSSTLLNAPYGKVCAMSFCESSKSWYLTCMHPDRSSTILYKEPSLSDSTGGGGIFSSGLQLRELDPSQSNNNRASYLLRINEMTAGTSSSAEHRLTCAMVATMKEISQPDLLTVLDDNHIAVSSKSTLHNGRVFVCDKQCKEGQYVQLSDHEAFKNTENGSASPHQVILGLCFVRSSGTVAILTGQKYRSEETKKAFFFASSIQKYHNIHVFTTSSAQESDSRTTSFSGETNSVQSAQLQNQMQRLEQKVDNLSEKMDKILELLSRERDLK